MKRNDIYLCIFIFFVFCLFPVLYFLNQDTVIKATAVCEVDGETVKTFSLSENTEYTLITDYGTNTIRIENGEISVTASDCGTGDCIKSGEISKGGEHIICLPHHLDIYIESSSVYTDAVTY